MNDVVLGPWRAQVTARPQSVDLTSQMIHRLDVVRNDHARSSPEQSLDYASAFLQPHNSVVLAISGDRGSGKSTLLTQVCGQLWSNTSDIVLPIVRPDTFGPTDTLVGVFLSSLSDYLQDRDRLQRNTSAAESHIDQNRLALIRRIAVAGRGYLMTRAPNAGAQSTEGALIYAEDAFAVSNQTSTILPELRLLMDSVSRTTGALPRLIVVPIDDPDVVPGRIVELLAEIRTLGSLPGVVPIPCINLGDLTEEWIAARQQAAPAMPRATLANQIANELEKLFPFGTRFDLKPLSETEKLSFTPFGRSQPISSVFHDLAQQIKRATNRASGSLHAAWDPALDLDLPSPLSGSPRSLSRAWDAAEAARHRDLTQSVELATSLNQLAAVMEQPLQIALSDDSPVQPALITEGTSGESSASKSALKFRLFTGTTHLVIARSGTPTPPPSRTGVSLQEVARVTARRRTDGGSERLSPQAVSAFLGLRDLALFADEAQRISETEFFGPSEFPFLQNSWFRGVIAGNLAVRLPAAVGYNSIVATVTSWNRFARGNRRGAAFLTAICEAVTASVALTTGQAANGSRSAATETSYMAALDSAARCYLECVDRTDSRAVEFMHWYEHHLPLQWQQPFVGDELFERAAEHTQDAIDRAGRERRPEYNSILGSSGFDEIIETELDRNSEGQEGIWLGGYARVARFLGSRLTVRLEPTFENWMRAVLAEEVGEAVLRDARTVQSGRVRVADFAASQTFVGDSLFESAAAALAAYAAANNLRPVDLSPGEETE